MRHLIFTALLTGLLALPAWPLPARAAETPAAQAPTAKAPVIPTPSRQLHGLFPRDPPETRREVRYDDSTSDCIGDPVTAMCAVDTLRACLLRRLAELCYTVLPADGFWEYVEELASNRREYEKISPHRIERYRVWAVRNADLAHPKAINPTAVRISLKIYGCGVKEDGNSIWCDDAAYISIITLRRSKAGRWQIVAWGPPY